MGFRVDGGWSLGVLGGFELCAFALQVRGESRCSGTAATPEGLGSAVF